MFHLIIKMIYSFTFQSQIQEFSPTTICPISGFHAAFSSQSGPQRPHNRTVYSYMVAWRETLCLVCVRVHFLLSQYKKSITVCGTLAVSLLDFINETLAGLQRVCEPRVHSSPPHSLSSAWPGETAAGGSASGALSGQAAVRSPGTPGIRKERQVEHREQQTW